jgi:hypothetical protein
VVAAPVFREIAEGTLRYLGVPPSIPARQIDLPRPMLAAFSHPDAGERPLPKAVPDLRGLDARAAIETAVASGLSVGVVGSGVVQSQQPMPGQTLPDDRRIELMLGAEIHASPSPRPSPRPSPGFPVPVAVIESQNPGAGAGAGSGSGSEKTGGHP